MDDDAPSKSVKGPSQYDRFIEAARTLSANEDEAVFEVKLAVIARQKPKNVPEPNEDGA